jgi:hypothetical protein
MTRRFGLRLSAGGEFVNRIAFQSENQFVERGFSKPEIDQPSLDSTRSFGGVGHGFTLLQY